MFFNSTSFLVVCLIWLASTVITAHGQEDVPPAKVVVAMERLERIIAEAARHSAHFKLHGKLLSYQLGLGSSGWNQKHTVLKPAHFEANFRILLYYASCKENEFAFRMLKTVDDVIALSLLDELQLMYLNSIAERRSFDVRLRDGEEYHWNNADLYWIGRRRLLMAALEDGRTDDSLGLLPSLFHLCRMGLEEPKGMP